MIKVIEMGQANLLTDKYQEMNGKIYNILREKQAEQSTDKAPQYALFLVSILIIQAALLRQGMGILLYSKIEKTFMDTV